MDRRALAAAWLVGALVVTAGASVLLMSRPHSTAPLASKPSIKSSPVPATIAPRVSTLAETEDRIILSSSDHRLVTLTSNEQKIVSSLLNIKAPMKYGTFVWNETGVPPGQVWLRVDLKGQTLSVFRGEHEIGAGVILFGADSHPTPLGRFPVMAKFKDHRSSIYDAKMPYTLRLTGDGISVHGSDVRRGLATHGCIGIPTKFAARIFDVVKVTDPVYILAAT
jgi:lipoprotein-anchoring transpeptidase ErfK/SrfK